jgi:hypothetical protein
MTDANNSFESGTDDFQIWAEVFDYYIIHCNLEIS